MDAEIWGTQSVFLATAEGRNSLLISHIQMVEYWIHMALDYDQATANSTVEPNLRFQFDYYTHLIQAILSRSLFDHDLQGKLNYWKPKIEMIEKLRAAHSDWFDPMTAQDMDHVASIFHNRNIESDSRLVAEEMWREVCRLRGLKFTPIEWQEDGKPKIFEGETPSVWDKLNADDA